jgi:hypothetical protein
MLERRAGYLNLDEPNIASRSEPMSIKRHFPLLAILAFAHPAFAQHPANRGGHPSAPAAHPGQQHMMPGGGQQRMTPQQAQHHFEQQMWNEQLMFMQMMNSRGGAYKRQGTPSRNGAGQQPVINNRGQANSVRHQNGPNSAQPKSTQAQPTAKQQRGKSTQSPGVVDKRAHADRDKEAKEKEADASKKREEREHAIHRNEEKRSNLANKRPLSSDSASISMLKTAQTKLRNADHDYAGHRVEAMRHVDRALEHLMGSTSFNGSVASGAGNLAQGESDRLLREAENHLRMVENTLGTRTNSLEHHHNARASVNEAIRQLHMALRTN